MESNFSVKQVVVILIGVIVLNKVKAALLCLTLLFALCACNGNNNKPVYEDPPEPVISKGQIFMESGFKLRSEMLLKNSPTSYPLIFEVYVDGDGDGSGLVGYRDNVYDVYIVDHVVYIVVSGGITAHLTDINSHMIPASLNIYNANDLGALGFIYMNNVVASYGGGNDYVTITTKYESSSAQFEPVAITQSNSMTTRDLIKYFFEADDTVYTEDPDKETEKEPERQSFYLNNEFGIDIHGVRYSIGDYCSPYTYFEYLTPQGMGTKEDYKQDQLVTFTYVSYISSDGGTMFMTTDGYVQAISTTSRFTFLGKIKRGMTASDLEKILGIGLKGDAAKNFEPLIKGMKASKVNNNYKITYGNYTVELEMNTKSKTLAAITLTNYLDFRS